MSTDHVNEPEDELPGKSSEPDERTPMASEHWLELKLPPVVVFGLFAVVMWAISQYFPVFAVEIPFQYYLTAFLMIIAIWISIYSLYLFYKNRTTVHPQNPGDTNKLVTSGPFRHTRNPMYLALSLILIGWAIFLSDLLALMLMPLYYAYMTRFQIIPEERELQQKLGSEYEKYADRTPRWL